MPIVRFVIHHLLPFLAVLFFSAGLFWMLPTKYQEWKRTGSMRVAPYRLRSRWAACSFLAFDALFAVGCIPLAFRCLVVGFYGHIGGSHFY